MPELWVAFIVTCMSQTCDGTKHYASKANYALELCENDAKAWAIFAKLTDPTKEYGYGCEKVTYQPKKLN